MNSILSEITDAEILDAEKILVEKDPLFLVEGGFLSIKTKAGELIKLKLNPIQVEIYKIIVREIKKGKPVRIFLLKYRQGGASTEISSIVYAITSQKPNTNALIMADDLEHANNLFEMAKLYQERLEIDEPHLAPRLKKSNEKKLEFEGLHSQIFVATSENVEAARSHTLQIVHLSEVGFFRNYLSVMSALTQSVPDLPNTLIVCETTANGRGEFYREWLKAVDGKTEWIPLFVGWFWAPEHVLPLEDGKLYPLDGINFDKDYTMQHMLDDEDKLRKEFNLSDEQINWRRYAITNKCFGNINVFRQEEPAYWQEAFIASGCNFFDNFGLEKQRGYNPVDIGEVFETGLNFEFRSLPRGRVKLYEKPGRDEQYIVSADASEGIGRDEASILVLNKRTNYTAAVVNGQYAPEDLADMCIKLANYYNKALLAPENKGYGTMVCQLCYNKYGNIYRAVDISDGEPREKNMLGFNTNSNTRPVMLARLNEEIRLNSTTLKDKDLISQCGSFIVDPKTKKAEAAQGEQDGLVICRAIAGEVRSQYPYKPVVNNKSKNIALAREMQNRVNAGFSFSKN